MLWQTLQYFSVPVYIWNELCDKITCDQFLFSFYSLVSHSSGKRKRITQVHIGAQRESCTGTKCEHSVAFRNVHTGFRVLKRFPGTKSGQDHRVLLKLVAGTNYIQEKNN